MILLDDAQSTAASHISRLYNDALYYWRVLPSGDNAIDLSATQQCFLEISSSLARGEFVVGAFAYELGRKIHNLPQRTSLTAVSHPLIEAWSFTNYQKLSKQGVDSHLS